jgi:hypothetical protein
VNIIGKNIDTVCRLLKIYGVANRVYAAEIDNFKIYRSQIYGLANVYSFNYKSKHYYVSDDHSLMDNPKFIENVFKELDPTLVGLIM